MTVDGSFFNCSDIASALKTNESLLLKKRHDIHLTTSEPNQQELDERCLKTAIREP